MMASRGRVLEQLLQAATEAQVSGATSAATHSAFGAISKTLASRPHTTRAKHRPMEAPEPVSHIDALTLAEAMQPRRSVSFSPPRTRSAAPSQLLGLDTSAEPHNAERRRMPSPADSTPTAPMSQPLPVVSTPSQMAPVAPAAAKLESASVKPAQLVVCLPRRVLC